MLNLPVSVLAGKVILGLRSKLPRIRWRRLRIYLHTLTNSLVIISMLLPNFTGIATAAAIRKQIPGVDSASSPTLSVRPDYQPPTLTRPISRVVDNDNTLEKSQSAPKKQASEVTVYLGAPLPDVSVTKNPGSWQEWGSIQYLAESHNIGVIFTHYFSGTSARFGRHVDDGQKLPGIRFWGNTSDSLNHDSGTTFCVISLPLNFPYTELQICETLIGSSNFVHYQLDTGIYILGISLPYLGFPNPNDIVTLEWSTLGDWDKTTEGSATNIQPIYYFYDGNIPANSTYDPDSANCFKSTDNRDCANHADSGSQKAVGDPVNTRTGTFDIGITDISVPTIATSLQFSRSYSSAAIDLDASNLAPGWTHNLDNRLVFPADPGGEAGLIKFKSHSANLYRFTDNGDGTYTPYPGILASLVRNVGPPVTYTITNSKQATYTFDESGRLLTWSNDEGYAFTNTYDLSNRLDRVTGPSG
ncbi:MAG: DUF6531 domain-containing protein, partial [Anaerolineae bacterium]|nr:DUF6531 domain-containing protein [Anaerolineae bacterium]